MEKKKEKLPESWGQHEYDAQKCKKHPDWTKPVAHNWKFPCCGLDVIVSTKSS